MFGDLTLYIWVDSLLANTEYTAGFYTFQREVKEIEGMNRNNKGWEPE
jgi:hypothetical protein